MPLLKFHKMHGLGNDFMVFNAIDQQVQLTTAQVRAWADRHTGVGFDQLLLVERPTQDGVDFRYRIFNADGSEVAQCGNGARCFARFVSENNLSEKHELVVETASGVIVLYLEGEGVRVNMGHPRFEPSSLPLILPITTRYQLTKDDQRIEFGAVSMGNPHAVILVPSVKDALVHELGAWFQSRRDVFPESVNVGFAEVVRPDFIKLRVYERGAGETQACGTGACAAMAVCRQAGLVHDEVTVSLPGGELVIRWSGKADDVLWMTGPAVTVFKGEIDG